MRETFVTPLGLITQPNRFGQYPAGAMKTARGLIMRSPGLMTPFKLNSTYITASGAALRYGLQIFPTGFQQFVVRADLAANSYELLYGTPGGGFQSVTMPTGASATALLRVARTRPVQFRDRLLLTGTNGILVWDYPNPQNGTERTGRWAQLPQPYITRIERGGTAGSLGINKVVSYAAVLRRKYADGYELVSAPSPIQRSWNGTGAVASITVEVSFPTGSRGNVQTGDIIEIYRSKEAEDLTGSNNVDSGVTLYLTTTRVLDASDASSGVVGIVDIGQANQVVGRELYTNPGQETLQSARFIPPVAKCISSFKGFAFYGNITQPGFWAAAFPGGLGTLPPSTTARVKGVGRRIATGTFTNGNPTITAISAADIAGLVAGQALQDGNLRIPGISSVLPTARILSVNVGAGTATMSVNAQASGTGTFVSDDVLELDGVQCSMAGMCALLYSIKFLSLTRWYEVVADETFAYGTDLTTGLGLFDRPGLTFGQRIQLNPFRFFQGSGVITVRGTNGANYDPPIPEIGASVQTHSPTEKPNLLQWSWEQQPESCAPSTYAFIGTGAIDAHATARDVKWLWKEDGLWRFTGYGTRPSGIQANFRCDLVDKTIRLVGPQAWCVMRDACYGWTNIGLVRVSDADGVVPLSRGRVGDLIPGLPFSETEKIVLSAHEDRDEVWITRVQGDFVTGTSTSRTFVWSEQFQQFTELDQNSTGNNTLLTAHAFSRDVADILQLVSLRLLPSPRVDWHDPAGGTWMAARAEFQPVFGENPAEIKQWVDMQLVFDLASAGRSITGILGSSEVAATLLAFSDDARAEYGVDYEVPAVGHVIAPGFAFGTAPVEIKFRSLSLRYETLTEQGQVRT